MRREGEEGGGVGGGEGRERGRVGGIKGDLGTGGHIGIAGSLERQTVARARIGFPPALAQSSPCCRCRSRAAPSVCVCVIILLIVFFNV